MLKIIFDTTANCAVPPLLWLCYLYLLLISQCIALPVFAHSDVTLNNGMAQLTLSPKLGRINGLFVNGENLICSDVPGQNWGGDHVLFSHGLFWCQLRKPRTADPAADYLPWEVLKSDALSVTLRSQLCEDLGVQMVRRIELDPSEPRYIQTYILTRENENVFPVCVWSILTLPRIGTAWLDIHPRSGYPDDQPFYNFFSETTNDRITVRGGLLCFNIQGHEVLKYGTFGGWIAQVAENRYVMLRGCYYPSQPYIDRASVQVFVGDSEGRGYVELEALSPSVTLRTGESLIWTTVTEFGELPIDAIENEVILFLRKRADALEPYVVYNVQQK